MIEDARATLNAQWQLKLSVCWTTAVVMESWSCRLVSPVDTSVSVFEQQQAVSTGVVEGHSMVQVELRV